MKVAFLSYGVVLVLAQFSHVVGNDFYFPGFGSELIRKLENAKGNKETVSFLKALVIMDGNTKGEYSVVSSIIENAEKLVISAANTENTNTELYNIKRKCEELGILEQEMRIRLQYRSETWFMLQKKVMKTGVYRFLAYDLHRMKEAATRCGPKDSNSKCLQTAEKILSSSRNALLAGLGTLDMLQTKNKDRIHNFIMSSFPDNQGPDISGEDIAFAVASQITDKNEQRASDFKYLRQNALVLVKSGVFVLMCAAIRIYTCVFGFGALMMASSVMWILIYNQLMDSELYL